jgi:uncharacterized protein
MFGRKKEIILPPSKKKPDGILSTDFLYHTVDKAEVVKDIINKNIKPQVTLDGAPLNKAEFESQNAAILNSMVQTPISNTLIGWYGNHTFIGYQLCAIISQQPIIKRACLLPAKDAIRRGYEVTVNDGTKIDKEIFDHMRFLDDRYGVGAHLREFVDKGRVFGIRHALFMVDSDDPDYYENPYNPDGVKPGSYRGIKQIDPYWMTPLLEGIDQTDPSSPFFYNPRYWWVGGRKIHYTHFVIFRTETVPDVLKPTYFYGGVSIPQKLFQRVYAAERTANEAPLLAMTKRLNTLKIDITQAIGQAAELNKKMNLWRSLRDNYGIMVHGMNEEVSQLDTSLADLDNVITSQHQLVSAYSGIPITKLYTTPPKGFDATGEYDEANYHEDLESLQADDLTPLLVGHYERMILSDISPKFGIKPFYTTIVWKPLDVMTSKEKAEVDRMESETTVNLINSGVIGPYEAREKLIADPESGFSGLSDEPPDLEIPEDDGTEDFPT